MLQIPVSATYIRMPRRTIWSIHDELKEVYLAHGWPGENYKKEECLEKVAEVWENKV
jgi:hypothetical protein